MNSEPLLVITGTTASGKSSLALRLARELGCEIVSADSMQLYRGLDIGTAKPSSAERQLVRHHLIDVLDIEERADVFSFVRMADAAIADIRRRNRRPIVAGGTGFYLKALLFRLDDLPADPDLRRELDRLYDNADGEKALHELMRQIDPAALAAFASNRRRLIRALEVMKLAGRSILELQKHRPEPRYTAEIYALEHPREILRNRIASRTREMLASGWIEEARFMLERGLASTPTAHQALGYSLIGEYLAGRFSRADLEEKIAVATWQFARRQLTFLRRQLPGIMVWKSL